MARPTPTLAHVAASLSRVLATTPPGWVSASTWEAAQVLLRRASRDVARLATDSTLDAAAQALGVSTSTLRVWRATWLRAGVVERE